MFTIQPPYIRDLDGSRTLMVPTIHGMVSAAHAVKHKLAVAGKIYRTEHELQQAFINYQIDHETVETQDVQSDA
jgi:hypothetical protein